MGDAQWSVGKKIGIIGGSIFVLGLISYWLYKSAISHISASKNTDTANTANTAAATADPYGAGGGYQVMVDAAQAIINALLTHGGNVSNANSLQSQWNNATSAGVSYQGNDMANVLAGAVFELKEQLANKRPNATVQATFNTAYNDGMNSAVAIEGLVTSLNSAKITNNTATMIKAFINPNG